MKKEQAEARASKLTISKALRNAEKKRLRLKKRARQLSDTDLLAVITMRAQEATGALGSASRPARLSVESTAADDGQEFDEGHDCVLYRGSKHVQKLHAATCHSLREQRHWSSTCHDVLVHGVLGTMSGHEQVDAGAS